ncbi:MAG: adenylate/guanylate cyclase domain-containing protein [Thermodesulfobacteriota bacterium]|nr:adenylate/guanylate cyclase domain-containing protein [Thermodesulfobacteriota bacterium]
MGKKFLLLNITINFLGAFLTFFYFNYINLDVYGQSNISHTQAYLILAIGTGLVFGIFFVIFRKWTTLMIRVADGEKSINDIDDISANRLKRRAIQFPPFLALFTLVAWMFAGFIFGFLEPVFSQVFLGAEPRSLIECVRSFFGITVVGGTIAALIIYFVAENMWRKGIGRFFPEGDLSQIKGAFRLSVKMRLIVVFLMISLFPLPLLAVTAYTKAQAMQTADAITRSQIMSSLLIEIVFITAICVAVSMLLSIFVSRSVSNPLRDLESAMKDVENGNLDVQVEIISNDEIGTVSQGFNHMVRGLEESQAIKESFGKYVSQEIRDEILAGRVSLDGEMKRATMLFSDLRNFTPLVESTHPKQVVTIMNQYFTEMTEAIKENRGLVLHFIGDAIVAVFGAPVSYDDHPDTAVEAALEMRRRTLLLNENLKEQGFNPLSHGIGIHTGAVLAGNIGSKDRASYTLIGDAMNLTSRIEGLTKEFFCDIILSQTTYNLLTGNFLTKNLSSVTVKGKKQGIMIYQLLGHA